MLQFLRESGAPRRGPVLSGSRKAPAIVRAIVLLCCFLCSAGGTAAATPAASDRPVKDKWALVIGISKFRDPSLSLQYASKDASDFYNYLITDGHFAKDHVQLLLNEQATRENILAMLGDKWLPRAAHPDDLVVIYISTHGSPSSLDAQGANYLVAHNTDRDSLYATGLPMQELCRIIKERVHSDRVLIVLDACHSGATRTADKGLIRNLNFNTEQVVQGTGQMVICSSEPSQASWESKRYNNGVFTKYLIDSLKKNRRIEDAFQMMHDGVQSEVLQDRGELQSPVMRSKWSGTALSLAALPTAPRAGLQDVRLSSGPTAAANVSSPSAPAPVAVTTTARPTVPVAKPQTTVAVTPKPPQAVPTALFGQYAANNFVKAKLLDLDQKSTGYYATVEVMNTSAAPVNPWNFLFKFMSNGYVIGQSTGSSIYGAEQNIPAGAKVKLEVKCSGERPDELQLIFNKPGWTALKLLMTDSPVAAATTSNNAPPAQVTTGTVPFGHYASNGRVRMRVLDTERKTTGFYITLELQNESGASIDPYYLKCEVMKDGYLISTIGGSSIYSTTSMVPTSEKAKLTISTSEPAVDEVIVKFPKIGWNPVKMSLK